MTKLAGSIIVTALLLITACGSNEMQLTKEKEEEIKSVVNEAFEGLVDAAKSLDVERYLDYFDAKRFTALNEDGTVTHSLEEFAEVYREQFKVISKYESLVFKDVKITVLNEETAVLVNEYDAKLSLKSGNSLSVSGAGTQVWSRSDGSWKLVNVSSSSRPYKAAK